MTVGELIEALQDMPEDMEVMFAYRYGDHWGSVIAGKIKSVENAEVSYSEYHREYKVTDDGEGEERIILSSRGVL